MLITASLTLRGDSFSSPDLFWVLGNHRELYQQSRHLEEACWEGHRADTLADTGEFKDTMGSFPHRALVSEREATRKAIHSVRHSGLASAWHLGDAQ